MSLCFVTYIKQHLVTYLGQKNEMTSIGTIVMMVIPFNTMKFSTFNICDYLPTKTLEETHFTLST